MIKTKKILSFHCILIFVLNISLALAQPTLYKIEINPLNRVLLYFDKLPADYISKLSLDKKKITISVSNCKIIDSAKRVKGTGIIQDIYANLNKNQAEINIFLKDKRGYTAVPLPYSQALMIECFQWDNLTNGEDVYREALLAIEDKIYIGLQDSLLKAASLGESNSLTFLSFYLLQKGYLKSSQKALTLASEGGSKIPDLYAALSQTYKLLGDEKKTNHLNTLFYDATGLLSFNEIAIPDDLSKVNIADDSLFQIINNLNIANLGQSQSDSLSLFLRDSAKVEIDTSAALSKAEEGSSSSWVSDFLLYFIILFFLMVIFVISSYLKWRKQQLQKKKKQETKTTQFAQDFEKAKNRKSQGALVDKIITEDSSPSQEKVSEKSKETQGINLEDKLEKIAQKLVESKKQSLLASDAKQEIETISTIKESEKERVPPKVELALHLLKEQQRLKQQSIASLKEESLAESREKLIEVAKKLKLEKNSVETQQKLEELKKNQQSFSKLKDKFSV
ncbi:MAG: hypothetical protein GX121_03150 [Ignavibacteria bacterium]|nr:hypothetical protein [Ignavibacteria bacterium]